MSTRIPNYLNYKRTNVWGTKLQRHFLWISFCKFCVTKLICSLDGSVMTTVWYHQPDCPTLFLCFARFITKCSNIYSSLILGGKTIQPPHHLPHANMAVWNQPSAWTILTTWAQQIFGNTKMKCIFRNSRAPTKIDHWWLGDFVFKHTSVDGSYKVVPPQL